MLAPVQAGVVDAGRGAGGELGGQHGVGGGERRPAALAAEHREAERPAPREQRHRQQGDVVEEAVDDAAGAVGEGVLDGVPAELDHGAGGQAAGVGGGRRVDDDLVDGELAGPAARVVLGEGDGQPPHDRRAVGLGGGLVVVGEEPFEHVDGAGVGEPGDGDGDDLACGQVQVEGGADAAARLVEQVQAARPRRGDRQQHLDAAVAARHRVQRGPAGLRR
ncbi:hypothetical protein LUX32_04645 [Actinomadura madurae]|nr:hypothetical protein [Actinomadura madurae]MCP9977026.1 hypothetical protein [Actinomadura madurae]